MSARVASSVRRCPCRPLPADIIPHRTATPAHHRRRPATEARREPLAAPNRVDRRQLPAAVHAGTDCMLAKVDYVALGQKRDLHGRQPERSPAGAEGRGAGVLKIEHHPSVCRRGSPSRRTTSTSSPVSSSPASGCSRGGAQASSRMGRVAPLRSPDSGPPDDGAGRAATVLKGDGRRCRLHRGRGRPRDLSLSAGLRAAAALPRI